MTEQLTPARALERELLEQVSADELWRQTEAIARWQRHSGTQEEREAFDYLAQELRKLGLTVRQYAAESLIGLPGPATLEILSPVEAEGGDKLRPYPASQTLGADPVPARGAVGADPVPAHGGRRQAPPLPGDRSVGADLAPSHGGRTPGSPPPAAESTAAHSAPALSVECITHSFAPRTGPAGIGGELVFLGRGTPADYERADVTGKIVVLDGLAMPDRVWTAEQRGAIAQIYAGDEHLHEMCISTVWGAPTPETAGRLPKNPAVSVRRQAGEHLRELATHGPVRVRMTTEGTLEWVPIPVLTADLVADHDPEHFVLFSGHVDSWYYGVMDNGSANATMLEVARLLSHHRDTLRRGIRFAFWSGHSQGRYAGSAWYADHHWRELHRRCVAHVNVDSTGGQGATVLTDTITMAETHGLAAQIIAELTGQRLGYKRANRAGDQSFWGVGVPSFYMSLSHQPAGESATAAAFAALTGPNPSGGSGGLGWWWHTKDDTLDKLDRSNLVRDAQVYVATLTRLCAAPVLPFDYAASAREIAEHLQRYQEASGNRLDLSEPIGLASELADALTALRSRLARAGLLPEAGARRGDAAPALAASAGKDAAPGQVADARLAAGRADDATCDLVNAAIQRLGHILVPLNYSAVGPFDHDVAMGLPPVPLIAPAARLASLDPKSDEYHYLYTRLIRDRNKLSAGLDEALAIVQEVLERLGSPG